ncbi:MAG: phage tail tape measure protein [Oscillospiraceae bacterium]|nr:phage tail tape measure protein [Oscillospiraceae bacterium]
MDLKELVIQLMFRAETGPLAAAREQLTQLSTLIMGVGKEAASSAMQFETAFRGVEKTVDGTDAQMAKLREGILKMSTETTFTAVEIAGVAAAARQLGVKVRDIENFSASMLKLGTASNLGAEEAATELARFAAITNMPIDQIDRLQGMSKSVINRSYNLCNAMFQAAVGERLLRQNHCSGIKKPDGTSGKHRALTHDEISAIVSCWRKHRFGAIAMLMLFEGLRISEACAFKTSECYSKTTNKLTIERAVCYSKGKAKLDALKSEKLRPGAEEAKRRLVPVFAPIVPILESSSGLVFSCADSSLATPSRVRESLLSFNKYLRKIYPELSAQPFIRSHDLRHTFATECIAAGVSPVTVAYWLGHADATTTTRIYTHIQKERAVSDVSVMNNYFAPIAEIHL